MTANNESDDAGRIDSKEFSVDVFDVRVVAGDTVSSVMINDTDGLGRLHMDGDDFAEIADRFDEFVNGGDGE